MPEPNSMKLGMYIMAPESVSLRYFINFSRQSVCLNVYLGNGFVYTSPMQRIDETVNCLTSRFLYSPCCVKEEYIVLCTPLSLYDNGSVKNLPAATKIFGAVSMRSVTYQRKVD
jgi:hypothetical protein